MSVAKLPAAPSTASDVTGASPWLDFAHVTKSFSSDGRQVVAVHDLSFSAKPGEVVALAGRSGSGKTTALNLACGLEMPDSGRVWLRGSDLANANATELTRLRRESVGRVFQSFDLLEELTAEQNVALPLELRGLTPSESRAAAREALATLGLATHHSARPRHLSGGEQQRVAIARAIAASSEMVLADEPTANLDLESAQEVAGALRKAAMNGACVIVATHDDIVMSGADRIVRLFSKASQSGLR